MPPSNENGENADGDRNDGNGKKMTEGLRHADKKQQAGMEMAPAMSAQDAMRR